MGIDEAIRILKAYQEQLEHSSSIADGSQSVKEYIELKEALTKAINVMEGKAVTEALEALKTQKTELRITPECKYRLPCGSCEKYDKFCTFEL